MASYFAVSVTFLDAGFHGRRDGGNAEWPPSPLRLFQALLAASAARWRQDHFAAYAVPALRWLERQASPLIVAARQHFGVPVRIAVPNNDLDVLASAWSRGQEPKRQPAALKTLKTVRTTHLLGEDQVHYLWELPDSLTDDVRGNTEVLSSAAQSIVSLGWGVDLVAACGRVITAQEYSVLLSRKGLDSWRPGGEGTQEGLRVPVSGTVDALLARHKGFMERLRGGALADLAPLTAFHVVDYRRGTDPPPRRWAGFRLRHPTEDHHAAFGIIRANSVAAMTRNATARMAMSQGWPMDLIDRYVHGHRGQDEPTMPRFSYLPLPSIEPRGESKISLGPIRRVLVAELVESQESHLPWIRKMLPGQFLTDDKTGERRAMMTPLTSSDGVLRRYIEPADTWATVTPVVLPGCDDGKFAKAERLFFKALRHAGYSPEALAELEFRNVSFWPGNDLARRFHRPDYLKRDNWSVHHVRLKWRQPIAGPLALGAGRHCGLGIFAGLQ